MAIINMEEWWRNGEGKVEVTINGEQVHEISKTIYISPEEAAYLQSINHDDKQIIKWMESKHMHYDSYDIIDAEKPENLSIEFSDEQ